MLGLRRYLGLLRRLDLLNMVYARLLSLDLGPFLRRLDV